MIIIPSKVKYLSYAGIIPILMGVIGSFDLSLMGNNINNLLIELGMLFSAVILSFLGGCLFVFETHSKSEINFKGLMMSMCPSIWAVFSLLLPMTCFLWNIFPIHLGLNPLLFFSENSQKRLFMASSLSQNFSALAAKAW